MPTPPRCRCHLCRPTRLSDPDDRETVSRVRKHGFTVIAVGTGACDCGQDCEPGTSDGPAFAYTIGLPHSAGHPELVVSGLRAEVMNGMLHAAAERVLRGFRFEPGTTAENVVSFWPVVADPMSLQGLEDTVLWSRWFHRRRVDALQLVWPGATSGIFSWQPGGSAEVAQAQPASWRLPQERSGALAADPEWVFPVPADHLAFACTHVAQEGAPIESVLRAPGELPGGQEEWLFLCPLRNHDPDASLRPYHFAHAVRSAPSLRALHDLALGEQADRGTCWSPWVRSKAV